MSSVVDSVAPTYLLVFAYNHQGHEMREVEFRCLMDMFLPASCSRDCYSFNWFADQSLGNIFAYVQTMQIDAIRQVASRIILLKEVYRLLSHAETPELCAEAAVGHSADLVRQLLHGGKSFRLDVHAFGRKLPLEQQSGVRRVMMDMLAIDAPVSLSCPAVSLAVWLNAPHHDQPDHRPQCWFGLHVASCTAGCAIADSFSLKKRPFLSPTAMPAAHSCIMANCAHVARNSLSWDPFCGSGSIMLICARFGAETIGSDIDYRVLHGGRCNSKQQGSKEVSLVDNFAFYKLPPPAMLLHADIGHLPWRASMQVDAIVCDPPYGVRAGIMCTAASSTAGGGGSDDIVSRHEINIAGTTIQGLDDVMSTFLHVSAHHLRIGGRLVFWQPTTEYKDFSDVARHPSFEVLYAPLEMIHEHIWSRRLVVMVKVREYEAGMVASVKPATVAAAHFKRADRSDEAVRRRQNDQSN
jgi:tRNA (guanine10-N2)-methyltransferase